MLALDFMVESYVSAGRTGYVTEFLYVLTSLFNPTSFILLVLGFTALIYLLRGRKYALLFICTLTLGVVVSLGLKQVFGVSRPVDGIVDVFGKSFPSGHAMSATMFFILLMYVFDGYLKITGRIILNTVAVFCIFLVAFSRVYLGAHWATDVLGGVIIGSLVTYLCVSTSQRWLVKKV